MRPLLAASCRTHEWFGTHTQMNWAAAEVVAFCVHARVDGILPCKACCAMSSSTAASALSIHCYGWGNWSFGIVIFQNGVSSRWLEFTIFYLFGRSFEINLGDETVSLKRRPWPSETIEQDIKKMNIYLVFMNGFFSFFVTKSGELLLSFKWQIANTLHVRAHIAFRTNFSQFIYPWKKCNVMSPKRMEKNKSEPRSVVVAIVQSRPSPKTGINAKRSSYTYTLTQTKWCGSRRLPKKTKISHFQTLDVLFKSFTGIVRISLAEFIQIESERDR